MTFDNNTADKAHDPAVLERLAEHIAKPVKDNINKDAYAQMISRIWFAFEQARTKTIPHDAIETITAAVFAPLRDEIDSEDYNAVTKQFTGALAGYTASDRH